MERKMGLSSARALSNGFGSPGIPIYRIMRVLQQVRTLLLGQAIGLHDRDPHHGSNTPK